MNLATLAQIKALDPSWLAEQGVADLPGGGLELAYFDEAGIEIYRKRRNVPGKPRFSYPKGSKQRPYGLWRLADMDGSGTLAVTEGESDAWSMWASGHCAIGLPGSDSTGCLLLADLGGASVLHVAGDNDDAGRRFESALLERLKVIGYQGQVYLIALPEGVKDISDLHARSPGTFRSTWAALVESARLVDLRPEAETSKEPQPVVICLAEVKPERVPWLWHTWLPAGSLCVLDGDPGLGKSTFTLDLAARLSRGDNFPPHSGRDLERGPAATLLLGAEDSLKYTVRPRLDSMGANPGLIHALEAMRLDGEERLVVLPSDLERMSEFILRHQVKLVVIDPLMAYLGGDVDAHKDQDVRRVLRPLSKLAERLEVVVLLLRHLNKLSGGPALYRGGSSIGITGASRASLIVGRDPMEDRHVLAMNKINVGPRPKSLAYRLEGHGLASRIVWEGECDLRPDQILGHGPPRAIPKGSGAGRPPDALEEAKRFLVDMLSGGPVATSEVMKRAAEAMIAEATLKRARADLSIECKKEGRTYIMQLPSGRQAHNFDPPELNKDETTDATTDEEDTYDDNPFDN